MRVMKWKVLREMRKKRHGEIRSNEIIALKRSDVMQNKIAVYNWRM